MYLPEDQRVRGGEEKTTEFEVEPECIGNDLQSVGDPAILLPRALKEALTCDWSDGELMRVAQPYGI